MAHVHEMGTKGPAVVTTGTAYNKSVLDEDPEYSYVVSEALDEEAGDTVIELSPETMQRFSSLLANG